MFTQLTLNFQSALNQLPAKTTSAMASHGTFWWVTPLQCLTTISAAVNFGKCLLPTRIFYDASKQFSNKS